ncbi:MAG: PucR family transcriptional regulator [Microbacterium gubbeenense]|uniref:PucR family transcriptional regulator n=9 Tax=Microbacterium gubbeenense TaxID=159896 RepID=UPI00041BEF01|nr:PucR family transcriptional regulator [Microbacterium gubbeenense]
MPEPTLGALLERRDLHLRLVTTVPRARLDAELRWVHSSDLPDPSPFLDDHVALLTTGSQFDRTSADEYVDRLVSRGVQALGFGIGVVTARIPADLAIACERAGLPLFEVPYRTPFLAVSRACADAAAAHAFARRSWALSAQRSVSLAALRDDPLPAAIGELARQLGAWVGLFDAGGDVAVARPDDLPAAASAQLAHAVSGMLDAGVPSADTLSAGGSDFQVQTLGRGGALRGALAIRGTDVDQEARAVITTVVAMAGFALERASDLASGHAALRAGVLRALTGGDVELARSIAVAAWGSLPAEPVRAGVVSGREVDLVDYLEARASHAPGSIFFAPDGDRTVILLGPGEDAPEPVWTRFGAPVGLSRPTTYARLGAAIDEARAAVPSAGVATYSPGSADLFRSAGPDQLAAARALLEPLRLAGGSLDEHLRAWLDHDASNDRTAEALGIHRHTVRAHILRAGELLDLDLSSFAGRASAWTALRVCSE